jgi:glycosyltransferase involved in cell wall biosynthesis
LLAETLRTRGHYVTLAAGSGTPAPDRVIVERFWQPDRLSVLKEAIDALGPDHVVLQYTPLSYALTGGYPNVALDAFWEALGRRYRTSLILHETYFRAWWHPPSWVTGSLQKWLMQRLVRHSHRVLTASHPLIEEIRRWPRRPPCLLLPLGTNVPVAPADRAALRARYGVAPYEQVLTLFGGGEGLRRMRAHVEAVDAEFAARSTPARWLLLGGIPGDWFSLRLAAIRPGFLAVEDLSAHLQMTDIFLMPHISGLCAKRSALIAALAHGLPVVGTRGPYTDAFWDDAPGVTLVDRRPARAIARAAAALATDEGLLRRQGTENLRLFESRFAWTSVAEAFVSDAD